LVGPVAFLFGGSFLDFLEIDGSYGEGGGQAVRIATSFAVILNRPIRVTRVRAGRKIPGLRPQHATTLKILTEVCGGTIEGARIGSTEFSFVPGKVQSRSMKVDTGTAASVTLALQAIVPAISLSGASLDLELVGGTDVPWSPTCDYFSTVLSESLHRLGISFSLEVLRRGYYPAGGGRVKVRIDPCARVKAVRLENRTQDPPISLISRAGMLPQRVAEQLLSSAASQLERNGLHPGDESMKIEESSSPGCSILLSSVGDSCLMGADSIGVRGKPALRIGSEAGVRFARSYGTKACVDPHLADMLSPLLFLADGPSTLSTPEVSSHLRTSLHIAKQFVDAEYTVVAKDGFNLISISPGQQNS
jgi:RNA 3'-phosphate cyclase